MRAQQRAFAASCLLLSLVVSWPVFSEAKRYATEQLPEDHIRVRRNDDAGPHSPEQVHLAFAGPGTVSVRWVTWPQEDVEEYQTQLDSLIYDDAVESSTPLVASASRKLLLQDVAPSTTNVVSLSLDRHHHKHHHHHDDDDDGSHSPHCRALKAMHLASSVQWGTKSRTYRHTVTGTLNCYSTVAYNSGALHHAIIGDVEPLPSNTKIYYRVGDDTRNVWSKEFTFNAPPAVGTASFPYRIGLLGDLGQTVHSATTLDHLSQHNVDSVVLAGDLSYADGFQGRWDTWGRLVSPATSTMPWMYTQGNHEIETTHGAPDFLAFTKRFHLPHNASSSPSPLFYSYDVAGAHILMLGSYTNYEKDSAQAEWLQNDLANVDRARTPWILAVLHAPWYNSNYNHYGEGEDMRRSFEKILYQHGVDVVIAGHVHAYERSHHVYDNKLNRCGLLYINVGDGGNHEGLDFDYHDQPKWSAVRDPSYGHGVFEMVNSTHASFAWYRNQDGIKEIADEAWLERKTTEECTKMRMNGVVN